MQPHLPGLCTTGRNDWVLPCSMPQCSDVITEAHQEPRNRNAAASVSIARIPASTAQYDTVSIDSLQAGCGVRQQAEVYQQSRLLVAHGVNRRQANINCRAVEGERAMVSEFASSVRCVNDTHPRFTEWATRRARVDCRILHLHALVGSSTGRLCRPVLAADRGRAQISFSLSCAQVQQLLTTLRASQFVSFTQQYSIVDPGGRSFPSLGSWRTESLVSEQWSRTAARV